VRFIAAGFACDAGAALRDAALRLFGDQIAERIKCSAGACRAGPLGVLRVKANSSLAILKLLAERRGGFDIVPVGNWSG